MERLGGPQDTEPGCKLWSGEDNCLYQCVHDRKAQGQGKGASDNTRERRADKTGGIEGLQKRSAGASQNFVALGSPVWGMLSFRKLK